jgi:hypothetical protein
MPCKPIGTHKQQQIHQKIKTHDRIHINPHPIPPSVGKVSIAAKGKKVGRNLYGQQPFKLPIPAPIQRSVGQSHKKRQLNYSAAA